MPSLQGIFSTQGLNPHLMSPALAGRYFTTSATWGALSVSVVGGRILLSAVTHNIRHSPNLRRRFRCWAAKKKKINVHHECEFMCKTWLIYVCISALPEPKYTGEIPTRFSLGLTARIPNVRWKKRLSCVMWRVHMAPFLFGLQNAPHSNSHLLYFISHFTANFSYVRKFFWT